MGNFELALSLYRYRVPVCSRKTSSPYSPDSRNTTSPCLLILISARGHRFSAAQGPRRSHAICSCNHRSHKPQLRLSLLLRSWSDTSTLFRKFAVGLVGTATLLFQGVSYADAGSVNAGTPPRYPCEDVARYYSGTEGLEGVALMRRLYSVVSDQKSLSYKKVWDALKILDAADVNDPEASSEIIEIYSLKSVSKTLAGKPEGWNREHLWPRSYGLVDHPMLTDLHNIRPADVNVNSSRGNKYYDECVSGSNGCVQPANNEAAFDTETDKKSWTPPSQDSYKAFIWNSYEENREMGLLSTLLKWNELDPPSREEQLRNDRICHLYQHNRNPFIDHPEYANIIWKHTIHSGQPGQEPPPEVRINGFHYKSKGKDENKLSNFSRSMPSHILSR